MKVNKLSFPYPVLGVGDDIAGEFRINFIGGGINLDRDLVKIEVEYLFANKTLSRLLRDGRAMYCIEIECPQTVYRKSFFSKNPKQMIEISANQLRNNTNITAFIVATTKITKFIPDGLNLDYEKSSFNLEKGDVLAYYDAGKFFAGKTWEAIRAVSSIITVEEDKTEKTKITFTLTDEKIVVTMPTGSFQKYGKLYKIPGLEAIFLSSIALPALMYALSEMMEKENENVDTTWYQILEVRRREDPSLKGITWDLVNVPTIAQAILGWPIGSMLKSVEDILYAEFSSSDS